MAKRVRIGDIMQMLSSEGVSYAQITHKHPDFGFLIRVMPGAYDRMPENLSVVVDQEPQFSTFLAVQSAVNAQVFAIVGNVPVAARNERFPIFRVTIYGKDGAVGPWWLWDGQQEVRLERALTDAERKYPIRSIISAPLLLKRIETGYRAEDHDF
ncbi:MAG: hypothetical protein JNK47_15775 [Mesorhizobium sp.]|nr:hypothetical protein [Mesorhizobium sp.]MBL8578683.1 hypothetical protein [Mesorhizobium sp.]